MRIHLFVPCFVDQLAPEVAWSTVRVLERLGHAVVVPRGQTCCGQPAFNSGFCDQGRAVGRAWLRAFADAETVVVPSGSCAGLVRRHYPAFFADQPQAASAADLAARTFELSELLVDVLRVEDVGARCEAVACLHDGCHGLRELGIHDQPRRLLANVSGLQLVELPRADLCCGFGGTFAVKLPELSVAMADAKLETIRGAQADLLISGEVMCLTHLDARVRWRGDGLDRGHLRVLHLAQVLAGDGGERPA